MFTSDVLLDIHARTHQNFATLIDRCRALPEGAIDKELDGFGYPTVQEQLHHAIGAEKYWVGVINGVVMTDEDAPDCPMLDDLEAYRADVAATTIAYLQAASPEELNTPRPMTVFGGTQRDLVPAYIVMRTATHLYHHQGIVVAMSRLLGHPVGDLAFPLL